MGKQVYLADKDAERLYALLRNELDSGDLSEEDCDWYYKMLEKLSK
ncbi:hypothetical protein QTG56_25710 (plasmid) [Rossellomorea sp. AcN35-11]|nr:hypothetical protein [Rossellomorea aquimaris]WJV32013.1 hypothetical protein QTG56_25710 [Rossellomorea sp. AcN35-11]